MLGLSVTPPGPLSDMTYRSENKIQQVSADSLQLVQMQRSVFYVKVRKNLKNVWSSILALKHPRIKSTALICSVFM